MWFNNKLKILLMHSEYIQIQLHANFLIDFLRKIEKTKIPLNDITFFNYTWLIRDIKLS